MKPTRVTSVLRLFLSIFLFTSPGLNAAPDVPTVLGAYAISSTQINLAWSPALGAVAPAHYNIYRNGQVIATMPGIANNIWKEPGYFQDVGLSPSTAYTYRVTSVDASNDESSPSPALTVTTLPPQETGLIPPSRRAAWIPGVTAGVPGGIQSNQTNIIDVTQAPYNVDKTGVRPAAVLIEQAVGEAPAGSVIYLPEGRYLMERTLYVTASNRTIRGAGIGKTILDGKGGTVFLRGGDGFYRNPETTVSPWLKGDANITVADPSLFNVGTLVNIFNDDRVLPVMSTGGWTIRGQGGVVRAINGNVLTIDPPMLYSSVGPDRRILAAPVTLRNVGIEDLTIDCWYGGAQVGLMMAGNYACWAKNVMIRGHRNYGIMMADSVFCEVRGCYIDQANRPLLSSNGAGLLTGQVSASLFEDNIIRKNFPLIEINGHSSGNIFGYNMMTEGVADSNHGPHNSYNLYEGNLMDGFLSDAYFGGESDTTLYRNWITGASFGIALKRWSRRFNIVGNQIGGDNIPNSWAGTSYTNGVYSFGQPWMGNGDSHGFVAPTGGVYWAQWGGTGDPNSWPERDLDVNSTTLMKANWYRGTNGYLNSLNESMQPGDTLDSSMYLTSRPSWFSVPNVAKTFQWPPFSPTSVNQDKEAIPAAYRYHNITYPPLPDNGVRLGGGTGGNGGMGSDTTAERPKEVNFLPFINVLDFSKEQKMSIRLRVIESQTVSLILRTRNGTVVKEMFNGILANGDATVDWDGKNSKGETVSAGVYMLDVKGESGSPKSKKVVVLK
jgi:hypothetical protein